MFFIQFLKILSFLNGFFIFLVFFSFFLIRFFGIQFRALDSSQFEEYKRATNITFRLLIGIFLILSQLPSYMRTVLSYFKINIPYINTSSDLSPLINASGFIILFTLTVEEYNFLYNFLIKNTRRLQKNM